VPAAGDAAGGGRRERARDVELAPGGVVVRAAEPRARLGGQGALGAAVPVREREAVVQRGLLEAPGAGEVEARPRLGGERRHRLALLVRDLAAIDLPQLERGPEA